MQACELIGSSIVRQKACPAYTPAQETALQTRLQPPPASCTRRSKAGAASMGQQLLAAFKTCRSTAPAHPSRGPARPHHSRPMNKCGGPQSVPPCACRHRQSVAPAWRMGAGSSRGWGMAVRGARAVSGGVPQPVGSVAFACVCPSACSSNQQAACYPPSCRPR